MAVMTIVVGPAPCQKCRAAVVWGTANVRGSSGRKPCWRDPITGQQHKCKKEGDIA